MLYCLCDRLDRGVDVREFLLCLYANSEPHKTSVPTLQVSLFPFLFIYYSWMASFYSDRLYNPVQNFSFLYYLNFSFCSFVVRIAKILGEKNCVPIRKLICLWAPEKEWVFFSVSFINFNPKNWKLQFVHVQHHPRAQTPFYYLSRGHAMFNDMPRHVPNVVYRWFKDQYILK